MRIGRSLHSPICSRLWKIYVSHPRVFCSCSPGIPVLQWHQHSFCMAWICCWLLLGFHGIYPWWCRLWKILHMYSNLQSYAAMAQLSLLFDSINTDSAWHKFIIEYSKSSMASIPDSADFEKFLHMYINLKSLLWPWSRCSCSPTASSV